MIAPRLFRRGSLLLLLMASPVCAQFDQLAATDDGKTLYFTSQMLFPGATSPLAWPESRLYRFSAGGVTLFEERGALASESTFSSNSGVTNVHVTGDGSLVGFTFHEVCLDGSKDCMQALTESELRGKQNICLGEGSIELSSNGHWALLTTSVYDEANSDRNGPLLRLTLIDLVTGQRTKVSDVPWYGANPWGYKSLASDGTVLTVVSTGNAQIGASLWKQGQMTPLSLSSAMSLTDDASTVFTYVGGLINGQPIQLVEFNVASGKTAVIVTPKDHTQVPFFMAASNNGQRVLYRLAGPATANGPAYVWDAATGATWPIPLDAGEFATAGTLTGGGDIAFVATTHGRIVRFAAQPGAAATSLFPATPYCDDPGDVAGGSLARLHCTFDIPAADLNGKVFYQDRPMPVIYSKPGELGVQIPWAWDNFAPPFVHFEIPSPSGFQPGQLFRAFAGAPMILPADAGQSTFLGMKIVKGDWTGLVTTQPQAGDIVHIYMTGLGPVAGAVATGVAAPLNSLRPIQWQLSCKFISDAGTSQAAPLLFAGLAPGTIGLYQTTFRMPALAATAHLTDMQCELASPTMAVGFGPGKPGYGVLDGGYAFPVGGPARVRP